MTQLAGQIGLRQHSTGFVGKLIEWATDSDTHHCVVFLDETKCMSAEWPRARVRMISDYPELVVSQFDLTPQQRTRIVMAACGMNKRPYNTAVLFIHLASRLTHIPVPERVRDWLKNRPHVDCSQLCDTALTAGGIDLFSQDPALVTPADFEAVYRARGWLTTSRTGALT